MHQTKTSRGKLRWRTGSSFRGLDGPRERVLAVTECRIKMTTVANLLARKQQLLERLYEVPGPHERDEIERLLAQIDAALNLLDEPVGAIGQEQ